MEPVLIRVVHLPRVVKFKNIKYLKNCFIQINLIIADEKVFGNYDRKVQGTPHNRKFLECLLNYITLRSRKPAKEE